MIWDIVQWQAHLSMLMNLHVPQNSEFLERLSDYQLWKNTLLNTVTWKITGFAIIKELVLI